MKNWKTTGCGVLGAVGAYLATVQDPTWVPMVGKALAGLAILLLGFVAKDSNVMGGSVQQ